MWLQGFYIYEALLRASPAFLDLRKPGTKPFDYLERPIALKNENNQLDENRVELERAKAYVFFSNWANAHKSKK